MPTDVEAKGMELSNFKGSFLSNLKGGWIKSYCKVERRFIKSGSSSSSSITMWHAYPEAFVNLLTYLSRNYSGQQTWKHKGS
jgi:hypothetical protein